MLRRQLTRTLWAMVLVMGWTGRTPAQEQRNLLAGDVATMSAFHARYQGGQKLDGEGELPMPWSCNLWAADASGEIRLDAEPLHGSKAIALRTLTGTGSIQLYNWQAVALPAGRRYAAVCEYWAEGGAVGGFIVNGESIAKRSAELKGGDAWRTARIELDLPSGGKLGVLIQNYAGGQAAALLVRRIAVFDIGEGTKLVSLDQIKDNDTNRLPDLKPDSVADAYYRSLVTELLPLHPKRVLLDLDAAKAMAHFEFNSLDAGKATMEPVVAVGLPFRAALRVATEKKKVEWMTHLQSFTTEPIRRGDVLYCTAWMRALAVTDGRAAGTARLYASEERGGNGKDSNLLWAADFQVPREWTRFHFPMVATRDFGDSDQLKLMFTCGHTGQTIEIGGVGLVQLGAGTDRTLLPHARPNLRYPGREPEAAWRKAATARIEAIRKADLTVTVVDAAGQPVPAAEIKVEMLRHAFVFGSSLPTGMLPGQNVKPWNDDFKRTAGASEADKRKLQETFLRYFNAATTSVTWAVWNGADARISRDDILAGLKWLTANGITCLDTQAVYPSSEFTPESARKLMKPATAPQFGQAVRDYITETCTTFAPYIKSIQLANEIEGRPEYTDLLGHDAVVDWFRTAQQANPNMLPMINGPYSLGEATVQTAGRGAQWPTTEGPQYYYDLIAWLRRQGAPVRYIGFQNHQGIGAPGPEAVLRTLDEFGALGLPIEVTEFEVTLQDGKDAEQRQYQAEYVRDYLTAVFSHPTARGIILQDFWQPGAWQFEGASCFFNADWSVNPHGKVWEDLVLKQWWTRAAGQSTAAGTYQTRGFLGDYRVTATVGGRTTSVDVTLPRTGTAAKIVLPAN